MSTALRQSAAFGQTGWKPLFLALAGSIVWAGAANAQAAGQGYAAVGVGIYSNPFSSGQLKEIGGGGEALIQGRFGVGGEVALVAGGGGAATTFSINGSLHFPKSDSRIGRIPFLSGGYTRMAFLTESGGRNAFNVGGGLRYWFNDRRGLLVEFRDVVYRGLGTDQYWIARIGLAFR